jgi:hypothetical protein
LEPNGVDIPANERESRGRGQDLAVQIMKALGYGVLVAVVAILAATRVVRLLRKYRIGRIMDCGSRVHKVHPA